MAQTEEFMIQNVAYRLTVYRTGLQCKQILVFSDAAPMQIVFM